MLGFARASWSYVEFVLRLMGRGEHAGNMKCVAMHVYLMLSMVRSSTSERDVLFGITFSKNETIDCMFHSPFLLHI